MIRCDCVRCLTSLITLALFFPRLAIIPLRPPFLIYQLLLTTIITIHSSDPLVDSSIDTFIISANRVDPNFLIDHPSYPDPSASPLLSPFSQPRPITIYQQLIFYVSKEVSGPYIKRSLLLSHTFHCLDDCLCVITCFFSFTQARIIPETFVIRALISLTRLVPLLHTASPCPTFRASLPVWQSLTYQVLVQWHTPLRVHRRHRPPA